jgi:hypothetical protein
VYDQATEASIPNLAFKAQSISDHDRLVKAFNQKRPLAKTGYESRVSSWSDPMSARGFLEEGEEQEEKTRRRSRSKLGRSNATGSNLGDADTDDSWRRKRLLGNGLRR